MASKAVKVILWGRRKFIFFKNYVFNQKFRNKIIGNKEYLAKKLFLKSNPQTYVLGLSNICNLECPLCITGQRIQKKILGHMPFELFKDIIDKVHPYAKQVQLYSWGESLLHPNFIEMMEYCSSFSFETEISSNLSLKNIDDKLLLCPAHSSGYLFYIKFGFYLFIA